jgi:hypothetical protein
MQAEKDWVSGVFKLWVMTVLKIADYLAYHPPLGCSQRGLTELRPKSVGAVSDLCETRSVEACW